MPLTRRAWLSAVVGLVACRGGASSPSAVAASWADSLSERPGGWDTVSVRLHGARNDMHLDEARPWDRGDPLRLSTAGVYAVGQAEQADFYASAHDEIAVLHDVPAGFDPMLFPPSAPRSDARYFAAEFRPVGGSAGVRAFQRAPTERSDLRDGTTYLFVLPNATWVSGRGDGVGAKLGAALAGGREPTRLPMVSGSLVDTTGCTAEGHPLFSGALSWLHGSHSDDDDALIAQGEVYYPGDTFARKFVYPNAAAATASAADVGKLIASGAARALNDAEYLVRARAEGQNLLLDYSR